MWLCLQLRPEKKQYFLSFFITTRVTNNWTVIGSNKCFVKRAIVAVVVECVHLGGAGAYRGDAVACVAGIMFVES